MNKIESVFQIRFLKSKAFFGSVFLKTFFSIRFLKTFFLPKMEIVFQNRFSEIENVFVGSLFRKWRKTPRKHDTRPLFIVQNRNNSKGIKVLLYIE